MAVAMGTGLMLGNVLTPPEEPVLTSGQAKYQKMQDIIQILDKKYVDEIDGEELFEKTIADMLHKLDPHSNYIAAKDLKALNEDIEGKFGGVGIRFFIIRDTVCVTNVLPNSPSEKAGLKAGDKILKVDNKPVAKKKITNDEIMGLLKGREGTKVKLQLLRNGKKIKKEVVRGTIPVESVTAAYMIDSKIGYIKIERFSVVTAREFRKASSDLKSKGMKKLIIDVRNNGGGVLTGATEIADEFLHANIPIVETRGEHSQKYIYKSTAQGNLKNIDVAVLINSNSASASEILAGAIQDNDRGIILGRRSFGKGLVQEDVLLRDGSNLRLTVARYYTPTGRCIQKPYSDDITEYYEDHTERYDNGELYHIDSTIFVDSLKFKTPKGRTVYGGGGIMPDEFIPYDSTGNSWYLTELRYSPAFTTFAFDYVQGKRGKWNSPKDFASKFVVTDQIVNDFVEFAWDEHHIRVDRDELKHSKRLIKKHIKGEIARQIWVEQGFYQVNNLKDQDVQEAIKALQ
jgi:carboxyl-terminal processing protease